MKTIGIKMRTYANEVNIINNNDIEKRAFKIILASFGLLSILYVLFLGNMVFNIIERRGLEERGRALSNEVMELEATYLSMNSKLDISMSSSLGFSETTPTYATRPLTSSLGLGSKVDNNEI